MKRKLNIIGAVLLSASLLWSCTESKIAGPQKSLKESLTAGSEKVNTAIDEIAKTPGYSVLNMGQDAALKAGTTDTVEYFDSISLADISGIYEYRFAQANYRCHSCFHRKFVKTGDSSLLIVMLPEKQVFHPYRLHHMYAEDSTLENNFKITATDYHYFFNRGLMYDYKLTAGLMLDSTDIGSMDIESNRDSWKEFNYSSSYNFSNDYSINFSRMTGDTSLFSFSLMNGTDVLLKESLQTVKNDTAWGREKEYTLAIGNVEIVRNTSTDSIAVYVDGVLQKNATVDFIYSEPNRGDCRFTASTRDIQITFDDGTQTTLSELIGPSMDILKNLVSSMHNMYFASNVVDYIAWNIHKGRISK